jgi:hypothetical protein
MLSALLGRAAIARVIWIDDYFANESPIERLMELIVQDLPKLADLLPPALLEGIAPEHPDADVLRTRIGPWWESLEAAERQSNYREVLRRTTGSADDRSAMSALNEILGDLPVTRLSMKGWTEQRQTLLASDQKTLILFDKDFGLEGLGPTVGLEEVKRIVGARPPELVMCGLVTHTISVKEEYLEWLALADIGIDRERVIVISKSRLVDDPMDFPRAIKLTLLSPEIRRLKLLVLKAIEQARAAASDRMEKEVTLYDFEHIVFRLSQVEGVWEPDTLFRLYGIFSRRQSRTIAEADAEIGEVVGQIRNLTSLQTVSTGAEEITSWKIQHEEMYEEAGYLRRHHLPLELGDIFKAEDGKLFILLTQPCDLAIRSNGKRNGYVSALMLAEVRVADQMSADGMHELPYYDLIKGESAWVFFRRVHYVHPSILDLCVYENDGYTNFSEGQTCPAVVIRSLHTRHDRVSVEMKAALEDCRAIEANVTGAARERLQRITLSELTGGARLMKPRIVQDGHGLSFGLQRIGRLLQPWSTDVLNHYGQFMSRIAFELDLGRIP